MKNNSRTYSAYFYDRTLTVNLSTGKLTESNVGFIRPIQPQYPNRKSILQFDKMLMDMFRLCEDSRAVIRFLKLMTGYMLLPPEVSPHSFVFYGQSRFNGATELKQILSYIYNDRKRKVQSITVKRMPPDRTLSDTELQSEIVFPFYSDRLYDITAHDKTDVYKLQKIASNNAGTIKLIAIKSLSKLCKNSAIEIPNDIKRATADYHAASDHVGQFIKQCCMITDDNSIRTNITQLHASYATWSQHQKIQQSPHELKYELIARGIQAFKSYHGTTYAIALNRTAKQAIL